MQENQDSIWDWGEGGGGGKLPTKLPSSVLKKKKLICLHLMLSCSTAHDMIITYISILMNYMPICRGNMNYFW